MYGLSERSLHTIDSIFRKYAGIEKAILYGSRAMGNYKNGSDIDIALQTNDSFSRDDLLRLSADFYESDLPYIVDCSIYDSLSDPDWRSHIDRKGRVIYANSPSSRL